MATQNEGRPVSIFDNASTPPPHTHTFWLPVNWCEHSCSFNTIILTHCLWSTCTKSTRNSALIITLIKTYMYIHVQHHQYSSKSETFSPAFTSLKVRRKVGLQMCTPSSFFYCSKIFITIFQCHTNNYSSLALMNTEWHFTYNVKS